MEEEKNNLKVNNTIPDIDSPECPDDDILNIYNINSDVNIYNKVSTTIDECNDQAPQPQPQPPRQQYEEGEEEELTITLFHETQVLGHCGVHAINNLCQQHCIDSTAMDTIALEFYQRDLEDGILTIFSFNPYKSIIPYLGFYDIAVVKEGLKQKHIKIEYHFARLNEEETKEFINILQNNHLFGLLINEEDILCGMSSRHWIGILKKKNKFVNLDSKLTHPQWFIDQNILVTYLITIVQKGGHIFVLFPAVEKELTEV